MDTAALTRRTGPPPGPPPGTSVRRRRGASWWRARWWGLVLGLLTDGVSTVHPDGRVTPLASRPGLPAGPLVVVANHRSHADSAALLATLGRDRPVVFAAATDYWHSSRTRRWAATGLMGVWPVRRDGHGWSDLAAAEDAVRRGVVLVVYPEGGRSRDGRLGDFHTGPFRLAARAGARVLPVALVGTDRVLPVHGRYARGAVEARWGVPIPVGDPVTAADAAHRRIAERLTDGPPAPRPGRVWSRNTALASSRAGLLLVLAAAAAEAVSWPVMAEVALVVLAVTATRRTPALIAACAVGSVCGVALTWWLVRHGFSPPAPLTTARMHEAAAAHLADDPGTAFLHQTVNGIPVKVYAAAAGAQDLPLGDLLTSLWPRVGRIALVGSAAGLLGLGLRRFLRPALGVVLAVGACVFTAGLASVIGQWR